MKKYYSLLLLLIFIKPIYSQAVAAEFLGLQQSPLLIGAGQIGAAIPMKDASGFYYNPAQLGYFSHENNLSVFFMPQNTHWWNIKPPEAPFQSFSIAAGYNFKTDSNNLPLSIGVGYIKNKFGFSEGFTFPTSFDIIPSEDSFDCLSIGACYENILLFNLGLSIKSYSSNLTGYSPKDAGGTAFDFGAMIIAPFSKLLFNDYRLQLSPKTFLKPKVDLTVGYSLMNIGKKIYYRIPEYPFPIPMTARLGYTLDFGIGLCTRTNEIDLVDYSFTAEAEELLIKTDSLGSDYNFSLGRFNIGKHLFDLKGDQSVVVHRGDIFKLFETVIIVSGRFEGNGFEVQKTNGYGFSSAGIFKILSSSINSPILNYIADHMVVEYYNTNTYVDSAIETNFQGIVINFKGIEF